MICPHCKKPISKLVTPEDKALIFRLHKKGYSCRDISAMLENRVSFSSVSRILKKQEEK